MPRALDVMQIREEDVLKFLAARTHLVASNGTAHLQKEKWWLRIINLKRA